jgi:serine/threonine protein kinase
MAIAMASMTSPPLSVELAKKEQRLRMWHRFSIKNWLGREEQVRCPNRDLKQQSQTPRPGLGRRLSRKVVPGLPRPGTFRRQNSERRERLTPVEPSVVERRAVSVERRRALSARPASPPPIAIPKHSAPAVLELDDGYPSVGRRDTCPDLSLHDTDIHQHPPPPSPPPPPPSDHNANVDEPAPSEASGDQDMDEEIKEELEKKWILNLSMHFRDHSPREKFFLTYAETPHRWRRVTISCDYRDAPVESLENDLQALHFQRDKSARIYESIRMSLPDIQFYDTVTNLKLETRDERLHVHVTEDVNEIIPYPAVSAVQHIPGKRFKESELKFEAHMSGFVYKVQVQNEMWIKKEIPGPDSVDEFLYEINALTELKGSTSVVQFKGLVVDEGESLVKGLLIGFAEQGALVDMLYDNKGHLSWTRREKWAKQITQGLSEIHEAGFVQGDFTLSNIVIDEHDDAKIIDINRRGCPVGWEPPEISKLIESGLRISMYIGVKSDLFQLGMVLWGLAKEEDEPERHPRDLTLHAVRDDLPPYFCDLTARCLSKDPKRRWAARDLLSMFPLLDSGNLEPLDPRHESPAGNLDELEADLGAPSLEGYDLDGYSIRDGELPHGHYVQSSRPGSVDIPFDGPGSYMDIGRGRRPPSNISHLSFYNRSRPASPGHSESYEPQIVPVSPSGEHRWGELEIGGTPYIVQRDSFPYQTFNGHSPAVVPGFGRQFSHVDSGLADMDLLNGVGEHENLRGDNKYRRDGTPRGGADELSLENNDSHGN